MPLFRRSLLPTTPPHFSPLPVKAIRDICGLWLLSIHFSSFSVYRTLFFFGEWDPCPSSVHVFSGKEPIFDSKSGHVSQTWSTRAPSVYFVELSGKRCSLSAGVIEMVMGWAWESWCPALPQQGISWSENKTVWSETAKRWRDISAVARCPGISSDS